MKLQTVQISEFRSIIDSNEFEIGDITCLVGKNEAGKTAILQALHRLNPVPPLIADFDVTEDYPRNSVEDYRAEIENKQRNPAVITQATFSLEALEVEPIEEEFGKDVFNKRILYLHKNYENENHFTLYLDVKNAIKFLLGPIDLDPDTKKVLKEAQDFNELDNKLTEEIPPTRLEAIKDLQEKTKAINETSFEEYVYRNYIEDHIPHFLYFDEYYQMTGHENLDALLSRKNEGKLIKSDLPLLGLLGLARIDLDDISKLNRTEDLVSKLEGASNHLSNKILKYWSQNKYIELKFDIRPGQSGDPPGMTSGTNLWARVLDTKHKVTTLLGSRSRGFVWFFSFLAWYNEQQKNQQPLILLLDEPGLFLHGKAQGDLLRFMENELKPAHQVIYTTHSPFMIDSTRFDRVRIVQDREIDTNEELLEEDRGTKVITEILDASEDSLFPLQGALGYDISQALFVGPNSLIVEGVSDLLYIQSISDVLERMGRKTLSKKWTITPVGGSDKVPTFVALLSSQKGLNVATLIDIQQKDKQRIENLYKKKLLKKQNVLTFGDFLDRTDADIEDYFGDEFYINLVNKEYADELDKPVNESDLSKGGSRIIFRVEEYFKTNPLKSGNSFNHYRPARYFVENLQSLVPEIPISTLDLFEKTFTRLNELLN